MTAPSRFGADSGAAGEMTRRLLADRAMAGFGHLGLKRQDPKDADA